MALKIYCSGCGQELIVKHLSIGEIAKCRICGTQTKVPVTATETELPSESNKLPCPICLNYERNTGVCKEIHENVRDYPAKFTTKCNSQFYERDEEAFLELEKLSSEQIAIEETFSSSSNINIKLEDTHLHSILMRIKRLEDRIPDSQILNRSFWTRCWAVWGHALIPGLIIGGVIWVLVFIITLSAL